MERREGGGELEGGERVNYGRGEAACDGTQVARRQLSRESRVPCLFFFPFNFVPPSNEEERRRAEETGGGGRKKKN